MKLVRWPLLITAVITGAMISLSWVTAYTPIAGAAELPKWHGTSPAIAQDPELWKELLAELNENQMHYGAMAAASRMLVFFSDVQAKENAYRAVISLVDAGYPFSVQPAFLTGDLQPVGDYDFVNSYNLYKMIVNRENQLERWASNYFEKIDKENFPKYVFFEAIQAFIQKDYKLAEEKLRSILSKEMPPEKLPFVRKVVRTLARLHFEKQEYEKAAEIYQNFLLKLEPLVPGDWLEASWNLYYLKKYPEALGLLYNLDSKAAGRFVNLEKYTIRALAYRNLCAIETSEVLLDSFKKEFGRIIDGIKRGEPLSKYPQLMLLETKGSSEALQAGQTFQSLRYEQAGMDRISKKLRPLATYLYNSELKMFMQRWKGVSTEIYEKAANSLILTDENLRFLKFDVQREKYNPDLVFRPAENAEEQEQSRIEVDGSSARLHWIQHGDYWRDERLNYKGVLPNRCSE